MEARWNGGMQKMPDFSFQRIHMGLECITIHEEPIGISTIHVPSTLPLRSCEPNEP